MYCLCTAPHLPSALEASVPSLGYIFCVYFLWVIPHHGRNWKPFSCCNSVKPDVCAQQYIPMADCVVNTYGVDFRWRVGKKMIQRSVTWNILLGISRDDKLCTLSWCTKNSLSLSTVNISEQDILRFVGFYHIVSFVVFVDMMLNYRTYKLGCISS